MPEAWGLRHTPSREDSEPQTLHVTSNVVYIGIHLPSQRVIYYPILPTARTYLEVRGLLLITKCTTRTTTKCTTDANLASQPIAVAWLLSGRRYGVGMSWSRAFQRRSNDRLEAR